ncbi:MAG: hypothetical protein HRU50_00005, partial [Winogradskyella sp.]|uniref:hypothetical protein n=1 Tax=Winogradskyella sp. TaxID=1883156 RepID=UPI0025E276C0
MTNLFFFIFALPELLKCRVNQLDFTLKPRIGVVSLNSFCSAFGGSGEHKGATLFFINNCKFFTNARTSKQFTAGAQGAVCRNAAATKRTRPFTNYSAT